MNLLKIFTFIIVALTTVSCNSNNSTNDSDTLSKEEKQFVSRFNNELIIKIANRSLKIKEVEVKGETDILSLDSSNVEPVVYSRLLSTKGMELEHKKSLFISQMLPQILIVKYFLSQEKEIFKQISDIEEINRDDYKAFINKQLLKHDADNTNDLLQKLTIHPTSIILAQAAIESNWGSTRAYTRANNPFHIVSGDSKSGLKTFGDEDEVVFLEKYSYLPASILAYLRNINRHERFKEFRKQRSKTDDPFVLCKYLGAYSLQEDEKYIELLTNVIKRNNLTQYDKYRIGQQFVEDISDKEIEKIIEEQTERNKNVVTSDSERIKKIGKQAINIQYKALESEDDIVDVEGRFVIPNVYTNVVSLNHLPVAEKKQKFYNMLLPSVLVASFEIEEVREKLKAIEKQQQNGNRISKEDSLFLHQQLQAWKAKDIHELVNVKMITRPNSIMLAQAAIETGWGSSRFFIHANNTFGVWSFNSNESRISATGTRSGKPVYVKKYDNLSGSIIDYYKVIARGPYSEYRQAKIQTDDPFEMVDELLRYSELGQEYIDRVKNVMRQSNVVKYDEYEIDPKFIE